jgi:two-component system, LytTR family, sensor kinase
MKLSDNPNARFWFYNILFWVSFYTISIFVSPPFLIFDMPNRIILSTSFMIWIILLTGSYYWVYHHFNFNNKSYPFTVVQVILSALILSLLDVFARYSLNPALGIRSLIHNDLSSSYYRIESLTVTDFVSVRPRLLEDIKTYVATTTVLVQIFKFSNFIVWTAGFNAYNYSQRLRQKEVEKLAAENNAKDLELINLRSQLNPHFLFNALNSIHSLAMMKKDTASDAVLLLSDLMRYTLNYEKRDVVPLSEEIEVVEKYLQLEKIRFGKKLNAELDISDATLDLKIPPIIVQTLVENAIKHGLKESTEGVFIKINSQLSDNFLTINVINSGRLKKGDPSVSAPKNSGIGVENTRRRLQMIYGERATFDLQNLNEKEVIATLKLPI